MRNPYKDKHPLWFFLSLYAFGFGILLGDALWDVLERMFGS